MGCEVKQQFTINIQYIACLLHQQDAIRCVQANSITVAYLSDL
jgi:hypothetical protein